MSYQPPYTVTPAILNLVAEISETLGRLSVFEELEEEQDSRLRLRRINRIRTIQGSLAIEGNTLSEDQITAILEGKLVIAPPREVQEARNAIKAYEQCDNWQATNVKDLLEAHQVLMLGMIDDAGLYRNKGVGVMKGDKVVHMAPQADRVNKLMMDLFAWLQATKEHPLITSSVFHYEFEFIHPFTDGNGRMGRLWQTLILSQWKPVFKHIPVESMVYANQADYYKAINQSTEQTDCAPFIEFMLNRILEACNAGSSGVSDQVGDYVTDQVKAVIKVLANQPPMTSSDLMEQLGLKHRPTFRKNYLNPALGKKWIEMTQPDTPKSPTQKYRLTALGKQAAIRINDEA
jgi:Fic family protein